MSNQPNEAAQRYSPCREKSETLVGGVVTTMRPNDQGNWVRYSLLRKAESEIASLRSALAAAEKRALEAWKDADAAVIKEVESRVASITGSPDNEIARLTASKNVFRDERDSLQIECGKLRERLAHARSRSDDKEIAEKERDAALAKLAEAERDCAGHKERIHELSDELGACEKEREEARAKLAEARSEAGCAKAWRDAITAEGRRIGIALGIYRDESEAANSVLEGSESKTWRTILWYCKRYGEVLKERDRLSAQLAEAREALAKIAGLDYRNAATNGAAYSAHQIASAFLAPPSDRGAEGES